MPHPGVQGEEQQLLQPAKAWRPADRPIREIPRRQAQAQRPRLQALFERRGVEGRQIYVAYRRYGYRLTEIADHLGVHYGTVSRRLKEAEQADV